MAVVWAALAAMTVAFVQGMEVKTTSGYITGLSEKIGDVSINYYLGVPFAQAPVNHSRYSRPKPLNSPDVKISATKAPPNCMQTPFPVAFGWAPVRKADKSEDCLFLNIWAPEGNSDKLKPVLVFFPGGAFIAGGITIDYYNGTVLAATGDLVVVEVNSRVGSLGYLNLNIPEADGNQGLYDQQLALQWVQDNIASFGGDRESVTIFGHSAGSVSVSLHLSSPISRPLFKRAIMLSGTSYYPPFAMDLNSSLDLSQTLAVRLNCADDVKTVYNSPKEILECFKSQNVVDILRQESHLYSDLKFFYPRIGNSIIPESPIKNVKEGNIKKTEVLVGNILGEGNLFLDLLFSVYFNLNQPKVSKTEGMELISNSMNKTGMPPQLTQALLNVYFKDVKEEDFDTVRETVSQFLGDFVFYCPTKFWVDNYSRHSPNTYYYVYTHPPSVSNELRTDWLKITHFDEVPFIFGYPTYSTLKYQNAERDFSMKLVQSFTNFAKTG
ncbi:BCHE [Cordylochernes scorpioides]|uniref:Carboxylic ester hydrolase n=1 Tax=Cordylochernes scorpioides TaxID=51811 RepID=A0ABY6KMK9_9ARAC|nr:BCHE [Cordylochernes scorpioides]